jgi:ParB family chromosome partitioning protein
MPAAPPDLSVVPNVYYLPVERIEANPFQPRQSFSEAELDELAESIREHGVLQPVLVRPHPTKTGWFQLVSGERRWRACQRIERAEIPGTVRELSDLQSAQLALQENIQRQSLTDWEEARGIERLWQAYERAGQSMSKRAMARQLNMSLGYVANRLDALGYGDDVQGLLGRHRGVLSSARAIDAVKDEERRAGYISLVDAGKSFTDVTAAIQRDEVEIAAKKSTTTAPDAQTQSRSAAVARGESGALSRGRQLSGTTQAEANAETLRHARGLEAWVGQCDDKTFGQVTELARRILRGDLAR